MLHTGASLYTLAIVTGKGARVAGTKRQEKPQLATAQSVELAIWLEPRCTHRCTHSLYRAQLTSQTHRAPHKQAAKEEELIRRRMSLIGPHKALAATVPSIYTTEGYNCCLKLHLGVEAPWSSVQEQSSRLSSVPTTTLCNLQLVVPEGSLPGPAPAAQHHQAAEATFVLRGRTQLHITWQQQVKQH
jgi:hypothetical protein